MLASVPPGPTDKMFFSGWLHPLLTYKLLWTLRSSGLSLSLEAHMHPDQIDFLVSVGFCRLGRGQAIIEAAQGIYFPCVYISLS